MEEYFQDIYKNLNNKITDKSALKQIIPVIFKVFQFGVL